MDYAHQAPLSVEFPRQEYWSGLPFSSLGDLPNPGIKPASPAFLGRFFTAESPEKPGSTNLKEDKRNVKNLENLPGIGNSKCKGLKQKPVGCFEGHNKGHCCWYKIENQERVVDDRKL